MTRPNPIVNSSTPLTMCPSATTAALALVADSVPSAWTAASDGPFGLAFERKGTYTLTVTKTGYRDWTKSGIVVTADRCHVHTVPVTALLQK